MRRSHLRFITAEYSRSIIKKNPVVPSQVSHNGVSPYIRAYMRFNFVDLEISPSIHRYMGEQSLGLRYLSFTIYYCHNYFDLGSRIYNWQQHLLFSRYSRQGHMSNSVPLSGLAHGQCPPVLAKRRKIALTTSSLGFNINPGLSKMSIVPILSLYMCCRIRDDRTTV